MDYSPLSLLTRVFSSEPQSLQSLGNALDPEGRVYYSSPYGSITDRDVNRAIDVGLAFSGGGLGTSGPIVRMFHGSPAESITEFKGKDAFLTPHPHVAEQYATGDIMGAQKTQRGGGRVYQVDVDPGQTFDMTKPEHQAIYNAFRDSYNKTAGIDDKLPRLSSEGFIQSGSGLPGYGRARQILHELPTFDSMRVDDGMHGISLLVKNPKERVKIVD